MFENILLLQTKNLLEKLKPGNLPEKSYLAGGTAVALHLGHRKSIDLDFFTPYEFAERQWEEKLKKDLSLKLIKRDWQTLIGTVNGIKFSLFSYKYKQIAAFEYFLELPVASAPDLCAMKLDTIIARGTKRDFIDIYFLSQKFSLKEMFSFYQKKYGNLEEKEIMIRKSLVFFEESDGDEMPQMLIETDWEEIKKWFLGEVKNLG